MNRYTVLRVLTSVVGMALLAGCSQPSSYAPPPTRLPGVNGTVHGGQQPVVGATIQLYSVGTTGDGSRATPLLTGTPVSSGADGSFTLPAYSCANATEVYLTATGGDPLPGTPNTHIVLLTALGPCLSLKASDYIEVNELTTVAAAYALAPFVASETTIGSGSGDAGALATAFTVADEYVNTTTGEVPGAGVPAGYMVPERELDTLANIMSSCVNSGGGTAGQDNGCGNFFRLTTPTVGSAPTDSFMAMVNVAHQPSLNTLALYLLEPKTRRSSQC